MKPNPDPFEAPPPPGLTRRRFLAGAGALAAAALPHPWTALGAPAPRRPRIIAFSKPFLDLDFEATADLVTEVGWDGIECPVRARSAHIAPERAADDLPRLVAALRQRGKEVTMLTTDITRATPAAEALLRTMAAAGIRLYRCGSERYPKGESPVRKLAEVGAALKDLAALNKELGVQGGWQNHSGADYVGAPVWDIWTVLRDLDPAHLGICLDVGHATLEGGLSWPIQARLVQPHCVAVYVKDFAWARTERGWQPQWCRLGEGAVSASVVPTLGLTTFPGPISQHHEYRDLGQGADRKANFKRDLATLRAWLDAT